MKIVRIWVFFISLLGGLYGGLGQQEEVLPSIVADSLEVKEKIPLTLRFGADLYRIVRSQTSDDFNGFEAVADLRVGEKFFLALELGNVETTKQVEQVNFTTEGTYLKVGFDYNMYENWEGMDNHVTVGLRFASSSHSQFLNNYTVLDRTRFWPSSDIPISTGYATGERPNLNAQWFEVVVGFKVQLLKNIYMGLSLRLNRLLNDKLPENFDNIYIPGFNKKTEDNIFGAGFNYTLTYSLPFGSKK
jgi:hypothetical protein